jgi:1,4-dihydroxy-2-naphthoyl-CoA hydrolase
MPGFPDGIESPFDELLGLNLTETGPERVAGHLPVSPRLHQPTGIVHGGVYATIVETVASIGATLALGGRGVAVGIDNTTDFLRPVRDGELRVEGAPVTRGRSLQLWEVSIADERGRPVARGRVRLMNVDAAAQ